MARIKLIEGYHITAADKRNIAAIVAKGWDYGCTKAKEYKLEDIGEGLTRVFITEQDTDSKGQKYARVWKNVVKITA